MTSDIGRKRSRLIQIICEEWLEAQEYPGTLDSEATYQEMFRSLKSRGLSGVEFIVSDDHKGLKAAIGRHFQGASWGWSHSLSVKSLGRIYEGSSPLRAGSRLWESLRVWPRNGARSATRRSQNISKST